MNIKNKYSNFTVLLASVFLWNVVFSQTKATDPFEKIKAVPEKLQYLPLGSVKPTGWLQQQLQENLNGFTGHLDSLAPDLLLNDDIYGKNRLTKKVKNKNVGAISDEGDWQVQFLWWNSETQSNWWDGYIRTAILLNDEQHLEKIKQHITAILATQDEDGYLGIYDKELRYHFDNENGELWSKTTLLRGLLYWYEYSRDKTVLLAVQRAVDNVLKNYPVNQSHPFYSVKPDAGGLTHGLMFTDVVEKMYRITANKKYLDYCLFMYKDFSEQVLNEDAQYHKLIDTTVALKGHGVHTYEHLRSVAAAYYSSGNKNLKNALEVFLQKINTTTTPSGAPCGDEFIGGRKADASNTGYEYCSIYEMMEGYISLYAKTGNAVYGDKIETIFFNAAQGARHPTESSICYLKTDNAYFLTGGKNGDTTDKKQTRYRYSPVHKEAAVCCVPNAGKIGPSYIQDMWMKEGNTLLATILGPCELKTTLNGKEISIKEITSYPYQNELNFKISVAQPTAFTIKIRKPAWAIKIHLSVPYTIENDFIVIHKLWNKESTLSLRFEAAISVVNENAGENYFMYGPLVLSHSIQANEKITKQFSIQGFKEMAYTPIALSVYEFTNQPVVKNNTATSELIFETAMYNTATGKEENIELQQIGKTILRQVTFKKHKPAIKNKL